MSKNFRIQPLDIIGPCAVEDKSQMQAVLELATKLGITYVRAQVYKPRTSPTSFQGLGAEGITFLKELKDQFPQLKYVCEVCSEQQFESVKDLASIIQIGARNMQNFELLKYVSQNFNHDFVLLKRGFANTLNEWLMAAQYLMENIPQQKIILCERGSRSISSPTGVGLDFICAMEAQAQGFKTVIDPSHGSKKAKYVLRLAAAAKAMGFDGVMIETHPQPEKSVSDKDQALHLDQVKEFFTR